MERKPRIKDKGINKTCMVRQKSGRGRSKKLQRMENEEMENHR